MNSDKAFNNLMTNMDRDDFNEILFNWNESELNEDSAEILIYVDSRADGPRTGGADKVDKKEFIDWLKSDGPFDPEVYSEDIRDDENWVGLIERARAAIS